ncbi:MAG: A/G-specific adenine glycosylase [Lysobacterales bacterium]|nr:MAG: A/G-specific adenine glycosylase [Xanthomonadales bacterium]
MKPFAERVLAWFERHGRRELPWQRDRDPYRILIAELMLQQTQVATAIPYYERFLATFPDLDRLAEAREEEVLALWSGLGYYRRAHQLLATARLIRERHGGVIPRSRAALEALPGIGRSTAAAILAQAFGAREAILDGNVKRVLARHAGIEGWPGAPAVAKKLWARAEECLPSQRLAEYTQGLMDLGAMVCKPRNPLCGECPLAEDCRALALNATHRIPAPKPIRTRPERRLVFLIEHDPTLRVRLVRRPPLGIWPGLYCLPECPADAGERPLPGFRHDFTHFRLLAEIRAQAANERRLGDGDERWIDRADLPGIALPAPIQSRLERFWEEREWLEPSSA